MYGPQTGGPYVPIIGTFAWPHQPRCCAPRTEPATREELPKRWIDLLLHLDEQERRQSKVSPSASKTRTGAPEGPAAGGKDL